MERHAYLKELTDEALWKVAFSLPVEFKERIIELLDKWGVTQFTFKEVPEDCPIMTIWDYENGDKHISVITVGYFVDKFGDSKQSSKNLYIVDKDDVIYWGDDAILNETLWDVYHQMKEYIK